MSSDIKKGFSLGIGIILAVIVVFGIIFVVAWTSYQVTEVPKLEEYKKEQEKLKQIEELAKEPEPIPVQIGTKQKPLTLPYSWELEDFQITLLGLSKVNMDSFSVHGIAMEDHQQYEVFHNWKNLLHETNEIRDCIGFESMKLVTDAENTWDIRYSGGLRQCGNWNPQLELSYDIDVFDIKNDEMPKLLIVEILGDTYIFKAKILN